MGREAAVHSRLYATGKAKADCSVGKIKAGDWKSAKRYLTSVSNCLDQIWARQFEDAGLYFSAPKRVWVRHRVNDPVCGKMPAAEADGTYCGSTKTYYVLVEKADLQPWAVSWLAEVAAHEYGHHVQYMANIMNYENGLVDDADSKAQRDLASRRLELQAECFSGVAIKAMRAEMPSWSTFRVLYQGTLPKKWALDHGRLATQLRWFKRGYDSGSPRSCDTWSPGKRDVT